MTSASGALLGLLAGLGVLLVVLGAPPARRRSLADRIAPYLLDTTVPSRLLSPTAPGGSALRRLTAPLVRDAVKFLDKVIGGRTSVRNRLAALDSPITVEQFRADQVVWGAVGAGCGVAAGLLSVVTGHRSPILLALIILAGAMGGVLARDWWLTRGLARYNAQILAEFPVIAEMLALAVTAGEGPLGAIDRVSRVSQGHLADRLRAILADTRSGTPLQQALLAARNRTQLEPLSRFLDGIAVAIERGTPLADVLRAQAADVRAIGKRRLLEIGGRKEILMMVPVVFFVMPITIIFAFYPGLVAIVTVAQ